MTALPKAGAFRRITPVLIFVLLLICVTSPAWAITDPLIIRQRLSELLRDRNYAVLDAAIADLQQTFDRRQVTESVLGAAYGAFQPDEWDIERALNDWVRHSPDRYQARLARGLYRATQGWFERGDGWGDDDTKGEQLSAMRIAHESAIADLQHALRLNPRLPTAWIALIDMAGAVKDHGEMHHNLRQGIAAVPESISIRWSYAANLADLEAQRELEAFIAEALQTAPRDHPSYKGIATWLDNFEAIRLLRNGEFQSAIVVFDRALKHAERARLRAGRAASYLEIGKLDQAVDDLRAAVSELPWSDYVATLAAALWERGDRDEAILQIDRAIALSPMYPRYRLMRAQMRFALNRAEEALADVVAAEVFGRHDENVYYQRAQILMDTDPAQALRAIETARRLAPDAPDIQLSYAIALYRSSDCRAADALARYDSMCIEARQCDPRAEIWRMAVRYTPCQAVK